MTKLENSNCDKTQKLKFLQNSKTKNMTKLKKTKNVTKLKKSNFYKTPKLKL